MMYISMKNKARKAVSTGMREKVEEVLAECKDYPNVMFRLVIGVKIDSREV